jgi:putative ABC transport system substrate-binding protein
MKRRDLLASAGAAALVPLVAMAQTPGRVYRMGILMPTPSPYLIDPTLAALAKRGWIAGRNLQVESRFTEGDPERAEALTRELVAARVDIIVTNVTATAIAASRATSTVPIVMQTSGYPVEAGLAKSLGRPGGNVTGLTIYAGGGVLFGKFIELLRELVPTLRELGVLWGYAPPAYTEAQVAPATRELLTASKAFGINTRFWQTGRDVDLTAALAAADGAPLDALFATAGTIHAIPVFAQRIADLVIRRRIPTLTDFPGSFFSAGGVVAYSADVSDIAARAASFVDRILRGASPGELPIEQPTKYVLGVNLKVAKSIRFAIPHSILLRADRVIE